MKEKLEIIYYSAKEIVSKHYPYELQFFEIIWEVFMDLLFKWKDEKPKDWPVRKDFQPELLESLGAAGGELDLIAPSIMLVIGACISDLERQNNPKEKIKEIVHYNINRFLPQDKLSEKQKITEHLIPLLKIDVSELEEERYKIPAKVKIKFEFYKIGDKITIKINRKKQKIKPEYLLLKYLIEKRVLENKKDIYRSHAFIALYRMGRWRLGMIKNPKNALTTCICRANKFLNGTGMKIKQEKGWLSLEGFNPSKHDSNIIEAQSLYKKIVKKKLFEETERIIEVLHFYPEHYEAHEIFVNYCLKNENKLSTELINKLKESKDFFQEQKEMMESALSRTEESTTKDDYLANIEEFKSMNKVREEIEEKLAKIESCFEKAVILLKDKLSYEEVQYEKVINLMESVKKNSDNEALLKLCYKEDSIKKMFMFLKKIILSKFSKKIPPSDVRDDILSIFNELIKKEAFRKPKTLKNLIRFLLITIYRRLEGKYIYDYFPGLTLTDIRNISSKRKVERRLSQELQTIEVASEKIMEELGWSKEKYIEVCELEERLKERPDFDIIVEKFEIEDEKIYKLFKKDIGV